MNENAYTVIALAMRYVFTGICCLLVVQAFFWILLKTRSRRQQLRRMPDTGMIGAFYVLKGNKALPHGSYLPVPWEGTLGSSGSDDVTVRTQGVSRHHLFLSFDPRIGLTVEPAGGDCQIDGKRIGKKAEQHQAIMHNGSEITVGEMKLRLRMFSGMETGIKKGKQKPAGKRKGARQE